MKKKRVIQIIIIIICILLILGGVFYLFWDKEETEDNHDVYEELLEVEEEEPIIEPVEEEKKIYVPKKLKKAMKKYEDTCAWITIKDTNVDYPIMRHPTSDEYYLEHTSDGTYGYPGSIYMEKCNTGKFTEFNTLIYGHNMINGTMFKDLHKYKDKKFFKKHNKIKIYTPEGELTYQVFAAVTYDDRHIMYSFDFDKTEDRQDFLDSIFGLNGFGNMYDEKVQVTPDSHIITLSTCMNASPSQRFLVLAVQIEEEEMEK